MHGADELIARFRAARRDRDVVVIEGLHALKHALRFGAEVIEARTPDPIALMALADALAPDQSAAIRALAERCDAGTYDALTPGTVANGVVALARRPAWSTSDFGSKERPVLVLDRPQHLGNVGAAIRVAAAADAAGVIVVGAIDPFHPTVVRGGAGLQFALPCLDMDRLPGDHGPIACFTDKGTPLDEVAYPAGTWLAFGSERQGLSDDLTRAARWHVAIPMRSGVSSLNLATAVAVALYARM